MASTALIGATNQSESQVRVGLLFESGLRAGNSVGVALVRVAIPKLSVKKENWQMP